MRARPGSLLCGDPRLRGKLADIAGPAQRRPLGPGLWLLLGLLGVAALWAQATHPAGRFTRGGLPHGDGAYNYAQVRSLVLDGDLRLANDYRRLGNPHRQPLRADGWAGNHFTLGTAVTWVPSFVVAHGITRLGNGMGWWQDPADGSSDRCRRITMTGSVLTGWLALLLITRIGLRFFSRRAVAVAVVLVAVATPLWWYMTRQPSWSHAASAFAVAGLVHACLNGGIRAGPRRGAMVGLWLGLAIVVRPQDLVFAVLPLAHALMGLRSPVTRRRTLGGVAAALLVVGLCWLPQAWVWQQTYGSPWLVPQGPDFMRWGQSEWDLVLWSSRNGLLSWSPLCGLALLGAGLCVARGPARGVAAPLLLSFGVAVFICGVVDDWWGGWAFGGRRLMGSAVLFGLGWAALLDPVLERGRGGLGARLLAGVLAIGGVRLSMQLQDDYLMGRMERGVPQSMRPIWSRAFGVPLDDLLLATGTPGSWPASWVFAATTGAPPGRYDEIMGHALVRSRGDARRWDRLWIEHPRWALHGWGPVQGDQPHPPRAVQGIATLGVPLRAPLPLQMRIYVHAPQGSPTLTVGTSTGEMHPVVLRAGWHLVTVPLRDPLLGGLNLITFEAPHDVEIAINWVDLFLPGHDPAVAAGQ